MFLKSLQWRLVSFFCLTAVCLIVPIGLFLTKSVEDQYYRTFIDNVNGVLANDWAQQINDGTTAADAYNYLDKGRDLSLFFIKGTNKSYTVVNKNNNRDLHTSDPNYDLAGVGKKDALINDLLDSGNFVKALRGKPGRDKKLEYYDGRYFFDYAMPIGGFVLYFRYYKAEWQPMIDSFNKIIVSSLFIAFIIAFILGYMLSKTVTLPIVRIMQKARDIALGNFDRMLEVKSDDEIGNLTSTFNYMAKNLKETLVDISSEKNKIETILNYMTDGVVAFNLNGEVIHTNPASREMLGDAAFDGTFNDYAHIYGLDISLEDILYLETVNGGEHKINVNGKTILVHFAVFTGESHKAEGIIAVLQDITEQQKLENMRKEFVANVSHELRTPLTSIKSYTETLLDGALEDRETSERFLKVVNSEADRMTRLVRDLLQLSRLDNQQMKWSVKKLSFEDLVKGTVEKIELEAKNKGQELECFVIGEIPDIMADYDRLEQVLLNILSNAIKYTPEEGRVSVYIGRMYNEVYVKVADTGIGIPEQDMTRIFERFYRVDKARSREMGGTGLGLSIAREIVEAHTGTISLKSELGKGTEVTIRLPAAGKQPEHA